MNILHTGIQKMKTQKTVLASILSVMFFSAHAAQEPAKDEVTAKQTDSTEVIEVVGSIRKTFEGSIGVKRLADTVVDAITSEDIGQFSDDSIAGAIQRIPGVQVERDESGTGGDRVSIRGLGPQFVNSSINGRRLLSAGTEATNLRQMNFNVFPANVLSGVQVAKGQTASRPESGLAGQVDLQTLKPLDIKQLDDKNSFSKVTLEGRYQDISSENGFRINAITGMRNNEDTLGAYVAVVYADEKNARDQITINSGNRNLRVDNDGDGVQDDTIAGVLVPLAATLNPIEETPTRVAIATGVQYKPSDDLEVNWDLMFSSYNNDSRRQSAQIQTGATYGATVFDMSDPSNLALNIDENNVLQGVDYGLSFGGGPIRPNLREMVFDNNTENLITGVNVDYAISDKLKANFDVYMSSVNYDQDLRFATMRKNVDKALYSYDATGMLPSIDSGDINDLSGYSYFRSTVRQIEMEGENYGATAAFTYFIDDSSVISSIDFGAHYDTTKIDVQSGNIVQLNNSDLAADILAAGLSGDLIGQDFLADDNFSPARWFAVDYDAVATLDPLLNSTTLADTGVNPAASYDLTEDIFSLYGQANIATELFDLPLSGNIGVRAVYTDQEATGTEIIDGAAPAPVTTGGDYWEYLPSLNLKLELQDDMALRLGMSKTLSRAEYEQLAPINNVTTPDDEGAIGSAKIGNPDLNPMTSINYDLTFEYYTQTDGAFILSGFYKDVSDFILSSTEQSVALPGEDGLYNVQTFVNYSDGSAEGFEVGFYQPFDQIIPALSGFGLSANYTYVDSKFETDVGDSGFGFPGSSRDNFNFIAFYDQDLYSARLAYTYRAEFFRQLAGTGAQTDTARFTEAQGLLSLNLMVRATEDLSFKFNVNNLTNEKRRDFIGHKTTFLGYFDSGRVVSLSASYNF